MRTLVRRLGTLMIVAGVLTLVWAGLVWRWQDPFTALYTKWRQHQLSGQYEKRAEHFRATPVVHGASLATVRRALAADAARYRRTSKRGQAIGRIVVPRLDLNMI